MTDLSILGSKGGSKPHTPVESPDSLINTSYANILDGLSEGPIAGLVNGAQSIYLDRTPLANSDGSLNFTGVTWEQRTGEHDQDHIPGFPAVESQTSVGVELKFDQAWVQSFSNLELSAVRIQLAVGALVKTESDGDRVGYRVNYEIDLSTDDSDYVVVNKGAFDGKTTTGYQRSIRVDLPAAETGWRIRLRRTTPDSETSNIQAQTSVGTYTEIIDAKLQYPYTALCGLKIDASQFSSVPERAYRIRGRIVQVPTNYDPGTRTYTGTWDGTFKPAWTDCPPWIWRDIVLNDRYGLGRFIDQSQVDKWGLYQIAQYCDASVSDGKGGQEPRFTCNVYLQSRAEALTVLQDLASVFRGMSYYAANEVACSADMPTDPVYTYTNANVIDGKFSRAASSGSTRFSVAKVAWTDRENFGNQRVEYVQDRTALVRYGVRETEVTAFGCVSQGQAQRAGKYILLTNRLETGTISFSVGLDGTICRPGDIIRVADENFAGAPLSGRVKAATSTSITMDNDVTGAAGDTLVVILPKGVAETRVIRTVAGRVVTVTQAFTAVPVKESIYTVETSQLVAETYRILSVTENFGDDKLQYDVVAVQHNSSKFAAIDNGAQIVTPPTSVLPGAIQAPPTNVELSTFDTVSQGLNVATMRITWDAPRGAQRYNVWWKRDSGDWVYAGVVYTAAIEVKGIYTGVYTARVSAVGVADSSSLWAYSEPTQLYGKTGEPPALAYLSTTSEIFGIRLNWGFPQGAEDTAYTEFQVASEPTGQNPIALAQFSYPTATYLHSGMAAAVVRYFRGRLVDRSGNIGPWSDWIYGQSSADANEILDYITGKITETHLGQSLLSEIEKISGEGPGSVNERLTAGDIALQNQIDSLQAQLADVVGAPDWDAGQAYLAGSLVKQGGKLYRAKQDVPAGTPVTDAGYWEYIGDYASLGEMVTALALRVDAVETSVEEIDGQLAAMATRIIGVETQVYPRMAGATDWKAGDSAVRATSTSIYSAFSSGDMALARRIDLVEAQIGDDLNARFEQEAYARVTADEAIATEVTKVSAKVGDNESKLQQEITARTTADDALTAQMTSATSRIGQAEAGLATEAQTRAAADQAISSSVTQLTSRVGATEALVQDTSEALVDLNGNVSATRNIKVGVDVNGRYYGAGMGIGVENTPDGMQSMVIFLANLFAVMHQPGGTPKSVFAIQNGQVFMNSAIINQADIINLIITGELKSSNYVAGSQGIRINFVTNEFEINGVRAGQGRMNVTNQLLTVYDQNRMRVRLGIWG